MEQCSSALTKQEIEFIQLRAALLSAYTGRSAPILTTKIRFFNTARRWFSFLAAFCGEFVHARIRRWEAV